MAEQRMVQMADVWKRWEEITAGIPAEIKKAADAYVRRERKDLPLGARSEELGPTGWLEELLLSKESGMEFLLRRMLYAAWRLGEGFLAGDGWSRIWRKNLKESDLIALCRKIGYTVEEVMEETAPVGPELPGYSAINIFGNVARELYIQYPYIQLTAYLDERYGEKCFRQADMGEEGEQWRLWADGELLLVFLKTHDPRAGKYIEAFLACLSKQPVLQMDELLLKLASLCQEVREFLAVRPLGELEKMGRYGGRFREKTYDDLVDEILRERKEEALKEIGFLTNARELTAWLKVLYERAGFTDYTPLPGLLGHKAKSVRVLAEKIMNRHRKESQEVIQKMLPTLPEDARQAARQLLNVWAFEENQVWEEVSDFTIKDQAALEAFCREHLFPAAEKNIKWVPKEWYSKVRYADTMEPAPEVVIQYLFACYLSLTEPKRLKFGDQIVHFLDRRDLEAVLSDAWEYWLLEECVPKHRLLVLLCGCYGSETLMLEMEKGAVKLALQKRGELAEYVVRAMGANGSSTALMLLERLACGEGHRKPRMSFARVEQAALECFQKEADRLGLSWDGLADRVVSSAGFDQKGEQKLDLGGRVVTVRLMPDQTLQVQDEKGIWRKSVPKPRRGEDEVKAQAAKIRFAEWKKQVKEIYEVQKKRLKRVLCTGRLFERREWEQLFLKHPIMRSFSVCLLWGVYKEGRLQDTFCCLEDGTLSTAEDETYLLPETAELSLVHPVELTDEVREKWRVWMEEQEVEPLFEQLEKPFLIPQEQVAQDGTILLWKGRMSSTGKLLSLQTKYGAVQTEEGYCLKENGIGGILIQAEEASWGYHGPVALLEAVFLDAEGKPCMPDALPKRFVSSMARFLDQCL